MSFKSTRAAGFAVAILTVGLAATAAAHGNDKPSARLDALDFGFKFASAIETDPKGKGAAQTGIVLAYLKRGEIEAAMRDAANVEGWWRGVALAEVAVKFADEGRDDEARELIRRAEEVRSTVNGWENPRISSHIAHAHALLGDVDRTRETAKKVAEEDSREYTGQAVAAVAESLAEKGDYDRAMAELDVLEGDQELLTAWWRTSGYLAIARKRDFTDQQRANALEAAKSAAVAVPGWQRVDALRLVAEELHALGRHAAAVETLDTAESIFEPEEDQPGRPPTLLSELASSWARVGEEKRARALLEEAEKSTQRLPVIDQPGLEARIAMAYMELGDEAAGRRTLDIALERAAKLTNARPRALALVEICRQAGLYGLELSAADRTRLDSLLAGLVAPW
jgi:tetratricopeptide (TPR) repeat protein